VLLRFDGAVLDADRLQVNLLNKIAVGEECCLRGQQVLRGERFTYNFLQDSGDLLNGRVKFICPQLAQISLRLYTCLTAGGVPLRPASNRITANQLQQVTNTGGIGFVGWWERQHLPCRNRAAQLGECV